MLILFHGRRLNTFLRGFYCTDCNEVVTLHTRQNDAVWSWFQVSDEYNNKERHMRDCRAKHYRDALRGSETAAIDDIAASHPITSPQQRDSPSGAAPDTASRPTAPDKGVGA